MRSLLNGMYIVSNYFSAQFIVDGGELCVVMLENQPLAFLVGLGVVWWSVLVMFGL